MRLPLNLLLLVVLFAVPPANGADQGFYVGAGIGQMNTQVDNIFDWAYDFDESDTGFKIFGGYKFLPWLSVEGAYIDGGSPDDPATYEDGSSDNLTIELQSIVAAALFALPIGDRFELFIKPGIAYWEANTKYTYSDPSGAFAGDFSDDDSGSAFFLGAGAGFSFSDNLGARLEYEWFEAAPEYDSDEVEWVDEVDATAGFWSVSILYTF